eukprot:4609584-Amphidinium_carterae.1
MLSDVLPCELLPGPPSVECSVNNVGPCVGWSALHARCAAPKQLEWVALSACEEMVVCNKSLSKLGRVLESACRLRTQ